MTPNQEAWVMVPREPTAEMLRAGEAWLAEEGCWVPDIWRDMTAAAPPRRITREELERACRAHDAEDAAQRGEPSPWDVDGDDPAEFESFKEARLAAMAAALASLGMEVED